MIRRADHIGVYPVEWADIAEKIKSCAGWKCERCHAPPEGRA